MSKKKHTNKMAIIVFTVAIIICAIVTLYSVNDIRITHYKERVSSMNVVMSKIGAHLDTVFLNKLEQSEKVKLRLQRLVPTADNFEKDLEDLYVEAHVDACVVDPKGVVYNRTGRLGYWREFGSLDADNVRFILSIPQLGIEGDIYMYFISYFEEPIQVGDVTINYVLLKEKMSDFQNSFDISNYGENCISVIIRKNGSLIYDDGSEDDLSKSYNVIKYIQQNVKFEFDSTFESFESDITAGNSNTVMINYHNKNYYLCYYKLEIQDWTSLMLVPEANIDVDSMGYSQRFIIDISYVFLSAILLFSICFWYFSSRSRKRQILAMEAEKSANDAKTNFLSSMSHDIRTPMNAIMGMTEIALKHLNDPEQTRKSLEKINLSSNHLLTLINDILDISKIESGKMMLSNAEFSCIDAINTLINMVTPIAKGKGITLRVHTHNFDHEYLIGDELRINQVLINLLTNAIKYTSTGGKVEFDVYQEELPQHPDKLRLRFVVKDNGIGMTPEFQKVMYQSFSRAVDSRTNKVSGSGLGLAICKQMVNLMGGDIECQSQMNKGSVFTVRVDLAKGREDEKYTLPKIKVLAIDSQKDSCASLAHIFDRLNVEATIISSLAEINGLIESGKITDYKIVFIELYSSNNAGIQVAKKMRETCSKDTVIVITDIDDANAFSMKYESQYVDLAMSKPYLYRTVYEVIKKALQLGSGGQVHEKELSSFKGMKVLVAEDNDLNWEILYEILQMRDIEATRAENGKECVDIINKAKKDEYQAILMDVRMPVLGGREATVIIRGSETKWIREIPIVAMTADAFAEDIQACLAAGMDVHLSKPINIGKLMSILQKIKDGDDNYRGGGYVASKVFHSK